MTKKPIGHFTDPKTKRDIDVVQRDNESPDHAKDRAADKYDVQENIIKPPKDKDEDK